MNQIKKIGIVGGGQLAQMMTEAAISLGLSIIVVDPSPNCPAAQAGAEQIMADYRDAEAIKELADKSDVVTIDFEHVNAEVLRELENDGAVVHPSSQTIAMIQDKLVQCNFLKEAGLPIAEYLETNTIEEAESALLKFDGKMLLKKRKQSYDGKGNAVVSSLDELTKAWNSLGGSELYAEKFVDFDKELAVIIARDIKGNSVVYPTVETVHINNICHEVFLPGEFKDGVDKKAREIADKTSKVLHGAGVFAIEMFLTKTGEILINEIAPRVHNSGHPTIEGSVTSQFEQHLRAISGIDLGSTNMKVPAAVMINILGIRNGEAKPEGIDQAENISGVVVHLYDKAYTKVDRKMGHITATADTMETAKKNVEEAYSLVTI
ncbi:5-(carboxyamino)imidazole ribonucleotide synthase [Candidatus Saccharibacteria bacterium]|nr:5-(carboxyamino)imidazole ribonucleotide synthase [Candidatus Saccharibacteria bacterium]MBP7018715.1 5-(carboxyamino)imidazole ribonucleotide synthase [Candidatus Saccharibacteria bacterium]